MFFLIVYTSLLIADRLAPRLRPQGPMTPEDDYGFSTQLTFSPLVPRGTQTLIMTGVSAKGELGPPLTLPLTVGPGTISVAITLGANHSHSMRSLLANGTSELIGVTLIAATILVCYRYADRMLRALGATGTSVLVRLSAFILLCIGVQILWNGTSALGETLLLPRTH